VITLKEPSVVAWEHQDLRWSFSMQVLYWAASHYHGGRSGDDQTCDGEGVQLLHWQRSEWNSL